jgi:hypothetical protein
MDGRLLLKFQEDSLNVIKILRVHFEKFEVFLFEVVLDGRSGEETREAFQESEAGMETGAVIKGLTKDGSKEIDLV